MTDPDGIAAAVYNERQTYSIGLDNLANLACHLATSIRRKHVTEKQAFDRLRGAIEAQAEGADRWQNDAFCLAFELPNEDTP